MRHLYFSYIHLLKYFETHSLIPRKAPLLSVKLSFLSVIIFRSTFPQNEQAMMKNSTDPVLFEIGTYDLVRLIKTLIHYTLFRSEEHTSELQSRFDLVCGLLLEN